MAWHTPASDGGGMKIKRSGQGNHNERNGGMPPSGAHTAVCMLYRFLSDKRADYVAAWMAQCTGCQRHLLDTAGKHLRRQRGITNP